MSNKSMSQRAIDAAQNAKAIKEILKKLVNGGWTAAATEALKRYWPQVIAIACSLLLLVLIIFCSLPLLIFGVGFSSSNEDMSALNIYDNLSDRYGEVVDEIVDKVKNPETDGSQYTKTNSTGEDTLSSDITVSVVMTSGTVIQKNMFVALHTVYLGNNAESVTDESIRDFVKECIEYSVEADGTEDSVRVNVEYLTAEQVMKKLKFTDGQKAWTQNMYSVLNEEGSK